MKEKVSLKKTVSLNRRCIKNINHFVPGRLISIVIASALKALTPYTTIWLSAQLINELAGMRRPQMLTKWVLLTIGITAGMMLLSAAAERWKGFTAQLHDPCKDRIFALKFFGMDYADLDDQKVVTDFHR